MLSRVPTLSGTRLYSHPYSPKCVEEEFSELRSPFVTPKGVLTVAEPGITSSMYLATDYIHPTPKGGRCRVRVYVPEEKGDAPVVLCSELPGNRGLSVTRAAEVIAGEVIPIISAYVGRPPVWIEHHSPETTDGCSETFDLVLFSSLEVSEVLVEGRWRKEIGIPTAWKCLDRPTIETLIGEVVH
jgi:hypothetical protein